MKLILILSGLLFFQSNLNAKVWNVWKHANTQQKVEIIKIIKEFQKTYSKNTELGEFNKSAFLNLMSLINNAYAADGYECFYAGWPSKLVKVGSKNYCSSPKNQNSWYKERHQSKCSENELMCNPLLFGDKLCVSAATRDQRIRSYANCERAFESQGRKLEDIVSAINDSAELTNRFDDVLGLSQQICTGAGYQAKTGMCKILLDKIAEVKKEVANQKVDKVPEPILPLGPIDPLPIKPIEPIAITPLTPVIIPPVKVEPLPDPVTHDDDIVKIDPLPTRPIVIDSPTPEIVNIVNVVEDLPNTVNTVNNEVKKGSCYTEIQVPQKDQPQMWEVSQKVDQSKDTPKDFCIGNQEGSKIENYFQTKYRHDDGAEIQVDFVKNKDEANPHKVNGITVVADKYGEEMSYIEEGKEYDDMDTMFPARKYDYEFKHPNQAMFTITDWPVAEKYNSSKKVIERYSSTNIKMTNYMFFPRSVTPAVVQENDKIYMTLATGEKVIFDAKTGKPIDGAFEEKPKNMTQYRTAEKRFFPNSEFNYRGDGIWLEAKVLYNDNEMKPGHMLPIKSRVDGKEYTCKLKSEDLFTRDFGYLLEPDRPMYLNSGWQCTRFKYENDADFYAAIKASCPNFKFPELARP